MARRSSDIIVGLDIGTTKIAAIVAEIVESGLDVIGVGTHVSRGLKKGVIVNIDSTVAAIKQAGEVGFLLVLFEVGLEIDLPTLRELLPSLRFAALWSFVQYPLVLVLACASGLSLSEDLLAAAALSGLRTKSWAVSIGMETPPQVSPSAQPVIWPEVIVVPGTPAVVGRTSTRKRLSIRKITLQPSAILELLLMMRREVLSSIRHSDLTPGREVLVTSLFLMPAVKRPPIVTLVAAPTVKEVWAGRAVAATEAAATRMNLMFMVAPFEAWWMGYWGTRHPGVGVGNAFFIQH